MAPRGISISKSETAVWAPKLFVTPASRTAASVMNPFLCSSVEFPENRQLIGDNDRRSPPAKCTRPSRPNVHPLDAGSSTLVPITGN